MPMADVFIPVSDPTQGKCFLYPRSIPCVVVTILVSEPSSDLLGSLRDSFDRGGKIIPREGFAAASAAAVKSPSPRLAQFGEEHHDISDEVDGSGYGRIEGVFQG